METSSIVHINQGSLKGKRCVDYYGKSYYSFQGIPYAKPPIGKLRFKFVNSKYYSMEQSDLYLHISHVPEMKIHGLRVTRELSTIYVKPRKLYLKNNNYALSVNKYFIELEIRTTRDVIYLPQIHGGWTGLKDATKEGNPCYSRDPFNLNIVGAEDCLYLNVYTPSVTKPLKAVMLYIHGGNFVFGSGNSDLLGPDFLIHEEVVVVTINYRLGILGFLSLNDEALEVPGNLGLKDQIMALKWVQSNISEFGGDPNNVTVFGVSVGGASAHCLMLSPMSRGLFHKVILQSGCAIGSRGRGQYSTPLIAEALNLPNATDADILKIMEDMSVEKIFEIQEKIPDTYRVSEFRPFGVVVEPYSNEDTFLAKEPVEIIKSKEYYRVPIMIGYCSREGYLAKALYNVERVEGDFEKDILFSLKTVKGTDLSKKVAKKIKNFYYGETASTESNTEAFYLLQGDNMYTRPIYNTVRFHSETSNSPVYLYRMSIDTKLNLFKKIFNIALSGASHGDDQSYLFKSLLTPRILPESLEENGMKVFTKYWTTFAKTGNPNPLEEHSLINVTWKPIEKNLIHFVDIGENITVGVNPEYSRMKFWQEIEDLCFLSNK